MLNTSLSTRGVTIETAQASDESAISQVVQFELGSTNKAHSITNLTQGATKVQTEIIGTTTADYTRYRSIKTNQSGHDGKPMDVSKVVNVWAKSDDIAQSEVQGSGHQLLAQAVLGVGLPVGSVPVPIGELSIKDRTAMLDHIKRQGVYETSFDKVNKETKNGRRIYAYDVKIQAILYVQMMKTFASSLGLSELDKVDSNAYQASQPLHVRLLVDVHSRQLVGVERPGLDYRQTYSGYGLPTRATVPDSSITMAELRERLMAL